MLLTKEVIIPNEYSDFTDIFSKKLAVELSKRFDINKHTINLEPNKWPPYGLIYSLGPMELETLKTYIKTNLANSFIQLSKFPARALILFVQNLDSSLCLCVNYCSFNNIIIKN